MEEHELHVIDVEPNTSLMYLNGELDASLDNYMKERYYQDLLEQEATYEVSQEHIHVDTWQGRPQTLEEAQEMYGAEGHQ